MKSNRVNRQESKDHFWPHSGILALILVFSIIGAGCIGTDAESGDTDPTPRNNQDLVWPQMSQADIEACMGLDPEELASTLSLEYLDNPDYCESDSDCYCLSGSGVPFVGCANGYHARISFAGCYACDICACVDNACQQR